MTYSFSFNGIDMSVYGLIVNAHNFDNSRQDTEGSQLVDSAVGGSSVRPQGEKTLDVTIMANDADTLNSYIDSIKSNISVLVDAILKVDNRPGRYWMARWGEMSRGKITGMSWTGTITFTVFDAAAYDNNLTTSGPTTIDASPKSFNITCTSLVPTKPVWTLTWGGGAVTPTIIIYNLTSGEAIQWTGTLANGDVLEFDSVTQNVKLNGVISNTGLGIITNVTIPRLLPGTNSMTVTAFNGGTVTAAYRKRYS